MRTTYKGHAISYNALPMRGGAPGYMADYVVTIDVGGEERQFPGGVARPFETQEDALAAALTAAKRFVDEK